MPLSTLTSTRESVATSKKKTSKGKPTTLEVSTQAQSSSKISEVDLTLSAKGFLPFWDKFCQETSEKLWSATKTDSQGSVLTSSDGYVSNKIADSWFSVVATCLQTEKWLKISLPSSMFSVVDSTELANTNLSSRKIRVYPETRLAKKWRTWSSASRWCYNQAIALLQTERIGKYEWRKRLRNTAPKWVSEQPYNRSQFAVFQAFEAHKAACKSQGVAKFRSGKDNSQTIRFQNDNWKSNPFYPRETKGLSFQAAEPILEVMQHEPALSLINGQWFICYAVDVITPTLSLI
jgi:putative transposase